MLQCRLPIPKFSGYHCIQNHNEAAIGLYRLIDFLKNALKMWFFFVQKINTFYFSARNSLWIFWKYWSWSLRVNVLSKIKNARFSFEENSKLLFSIYFNCFILLMNFGTIKFFLQILLFTEHFTEHFIQFVFKIFF